MDELRPDRSQEAAVWAKLAKEAPGRPRRPKPRRNDEVFSVRGVPAELRRQLKEIAREVGVGFGEVVRVLLEHGVEDYRAGRLRLRRVPQVVRFGAKGEVFENAKKI